MQIRRIGSALALFALLGGCATSRTATNYDVVRVGDNNLSCDELYKEISALKSGRNQASSDADKKNNAAMGAEAAGDAGLLLAPFTGGLSLLATAGSLGLQSSSSNKTMEAAHMNERAQHLTEVFNNKGCKAPETHSAKNGTSTN